MDPAFADDLRVELNRCESHQANRQNQAEEVLNKALHGVTPRCLERRNRISGREPHGKQQHKQQHKNNTGDVRNDGLKADHSRCLNCCIVWRMEGCRGEVTLCFSQSERAPHKPKSQHKQR
ncbi:hypothetical protein [Agrobacterium sp.]|uniref:hypothetical protein n=1 Tax=Agrobacterium sp. TaxID=361 RepID=UPI0028A7B867|nr:hypothetical protein [Agrobacterium sp.]